MKIAVLGLCNNNEEHYVVEQDDHLYYVINKYSNYEDSIFHITETEFEIMDTENPLPIDLKIFNAINKYKMDTVSNGKSTEIDRSETL